MLDRTRANEGEAIQEAVMCLPRISLGVALALIGIDSIGDHSLSLMSRVCLGAISAMRTNARFPLVMAGSPSPTVSTPGSSHGDHLVESPPCV